jgi:hypothetical protein
MQAALASCGFASTVAESMLPIWLSAKPRFVGAAMARMVRFVETVSQLVVFVNPDLVRVVMPNPHKGTDIIFDNGHMTTVVERVEQVITLLDAEK